ncbi:hypothetical protein Tco_0561044 [Tanacetum coccineum]
MGEASDEVVYKKLGNSLVRAATTSSGLEAKQDSGLRINAIDAIADRNYIAQVSVQEEADRREVDVECPFKMVKRFGFSRKGYVYLSTYHATLPKTQVVEGVITLLPITTTEEKAQRRLEVKARSTLMMGISNKYQLKFNSINDAKQLLEAVEKRFGGNAATKKTQRNLLKQQYENFTAPSSEMLDQTFDRLQKLVSQLELLDEKLLQEDINQKLSRTLSPEWNTHAIVWRNKDDLDIMSMDDLYNNLTIYEPEVKWMSSSSSSTLNMAFVSSSKNNTSSTNEAVNTAHGVSTASTQVNAVNSTNIGNLSDAVICAFFTSQPNSPQLVHEDLQQIHPDHMEEMDLRWQMAMLTMRARGALRNQDNKNKKSSKRSVPMETSTSTALVSCDGLGGYD